MEAPRFTPNPEPLIIPPALEPVQFSNPLAEKRHTLYDYLYNIGEEQRFEEVAPELLKKPEAHYGRQGYTREQVRWVKHVRDAGQDLSPFVHITPETVRAVGLSSLALKDAFNLELHHIYAQAYCQAYLGLSNFPELINHPHNGITLYKIAHRGPYIPNINHSRHPDVHGALAAFHGNPQAMRGVFEDHWKLALDGIKYWNSVDDDEMFRIATSQTQEYKLHHRKVEP
jgi:hypothetical protein